MTQKALFVLPVLSAAVMMTACGRDADQYRDHGITNTTRSTTVMTDRPNHGTSNRDAGDVVSDAVDDGMDIASDVIEGGRDIASDINQAADDAVRGTDILKATDENDNYRVGSDGKTDSNSTR
ncbi:MAG: hypothetical protein IKI37_00115 [Oscillospiraceae bacterium]|nr:hypothetical protein [Oscillospiraceae bacterium]MBR7083578.1 hypothetical protein [Oscillospiraceae bacterium]